MSTASFFTVDNITLKITESSREWYKESNLITKFNKNDEEFNIIDCDLCHYFICHYKKKIIPNKDLYRSEIPEEILNNILNTKLPEDFWVSTYCHTDYGGYEKIDIAKNYYNIYIFLDYVCEWIVTEYREIPVIERRWCDYVKNVKQDSRLKDHIFIMRFHNNKKALDFGTPTPLMKFLN